MDGGVAVLASQVDALHVSGNARAGHFTHNTVHAVTEDAESRHAVQLSTFEVPQHKAAVVKPVAEDLTDEIQWGDGCFYEKGAVTGNKTTLFAVYFENSSVNDLSLSNCIFINVRFQKCNLSKVTICDTFLENVTLKNSDLDDLIWWSGCWRDKEEVDLIVSDDTWGMHDPVPDQIANPNWITENQTYALSPWSNEAGEHGIASFCRICASAKATRTNRAHVKALSAFEHDRYCGKLGAFKFLELPRLVRKKVYGYLLAPTELTIVDSSWLTDISKIETLAKQSSYEIEESRDGAEDIYVRPATYLARSDLNDSCSTGIETAILRTNSDVHDEAAAVLYGQKITFRGSADGALAWLADVSKYNKTVQRVVFNYRFVEQTIYLSNLGHITFPPTKQESFQRLCNVVISMTREGQAFQHFELMVEKEFWDSTKWTRTIRESKYGREYAFISDLARICAALLERDKPTHYSQQIGVGLDIRPDTVLLKKQRSIVKDLRNHIKSEGVRIATQRQQLI